jgi:DNA (cytosine-5)-methyltransferase 1
VRYLSVCSGIEAATVAWKPLGWKAAAFSEIEAFPRAVLQHHYPDTPLHGDFTTIKGDEYGPIDLLVGGTPCQSFSVAGLRGGMADDRGNLALEFLKLARRTRARWVVFENVPGLLSSEGGRDFGAFLGGLGQCGYGWAYRVLDAQYFGVPQRRRRVFVVGHLGDWRCAAAVLFERHSLSGDTPPRREKGQGTSESPLDGVAGSLCADTHPGCYSGQDAYTGRLIPHSIRTAQTSSNGWGVQEEVAHTLDQANGLAVAHSLRAEGFDASEDGTGRGTPLVPVAMLNMMGAKGMATFEENPQTSYTLTQGCQSGADMHAIAFAQNSRDEVRELGGDGLIAGALAAEPGMKQTTYVAFTAKDHGADASDISPTLRSGSHSGSHANGGVMPAVALQSVNCPPQRKQNGIGISEGEAMYSLTSRDLHGVQIASIVRRLTPTECARLQGFPDDYLDITYRGKPAADGPKYKALGNSMAVPVMFWIGRRIQMVEALQTKAEAA